MRRCGDVLRSAGKVYIHHSCGHMRAFLGDLAAAQIDGWDALTSPPDGDVTIGDARRALGDSVVLMPVIPATIVDRAGVDELLAFVREMYRQAAPGRNFVLWAVPSAGVPIERFRLIISEAKELSWTILA